jgi:hypothetical protein
MNIRSERDDLFHADGQADVTKLIVAFCDLTNVPKSTMHDVLFNNTTFSTAVI